MGDVEAGFKQADVVIEKEFKTAAVHQAYIEPHACVAKIRGRRPVRNLVLQPGPFPDARADRADHRRQLGDLRVTPAEIGGGFGGKTVTYLEPVAAMLSKKSGLPVRLQMTREDVFRASGPTSGASMWVKIGVKKDGTIVAADGIFKFQAGAFPGSPVMNGCLCAYAPYEIAEPARRRLRRRFQPAEGGGLSRARLADLGLRGRERARHVRQGHRHGPAGDCATRTPAASARRPSPGRSTPMPAISRRWRR